MLAYYQPAQDINPSHYQTSQPIYNYNPLSTISKTRPSSSLRNQLMPAHSQQPQNPPIRVQNSSPFSGEDQGAHQQMLAQSAFLGNNWGGNDNLLSPASIPRKHGDNFHKRSSSASSVASAGPPSPQAHNTVFPHIVNPDGSDFSPSTFDSLDFFATKNSQMQKSLPTPVNTPTQNHFNPSDYQQYPSPRDVTNNQNAMRRIQTDGRWPVEDDVASYANSGPQSVSSMSHHGSPATPQTAYDGDYDDAVKNLQQHTGEITPLDVDAWMDEYLQLPATGFNPQINVSQGMPSVNFEEFYNTQLQNLPPQQQQQMIARAGGSSPFRTSLANRFQAAQLDHVASRTSSPASFQREKSPFTQASHYNPVASMAGQRLGPPQMTAAQYQQSLNNAAIMAAQQQQQNAQQQPEQPKTVSPKDVQLEYHEEDQTPLFPSSQTSQFSLPRDDSSSNFSTAAGFGQPNQYYTTVHSSSQNAPQQYPFLGQQRRQQSSMRSMADQSIPDFPAHLASMETTASSDSGQEPPTPVAAPTSAPPARPRDISSDAGTYTCTNPGCSQRFDSPLRLQRHKRESHSQTSPSSVPSASKDASALSSTSTATQGHTSSAATIAMRNSQTGPHKCDRINPTTGKPCNSIFSRPYDLTRHEDTIHNGRKLKVKCHLCTEEKTFSRNDALTRHMRVVHPEVNWPGKQRRRGGRD